MMVLVVLIFPPGGPEADGTSMIPHATQLKARLFLSGIDRSIPSLKLT